MSRRKQPTPSPTEQSELVDAPAQRKSVFTFADAIRLTAESASWPLPVFEPDAARKAIEANGFRCDEEWRNK